MKLKTLLFICLGIVFSQVRAQQDNALITGIVINKKGDPVTFAHILLNGSSTGATTDANGKFETNIVPGTHDLKITSIGYKPYTERIRVSGDNIDLGQITIEENVEALQGVTLTSDRINKFANKKTDYVARMPLKNLENPQVYSIVGKEMIEEQIMTDIKEPLRSAPGVVPADYVTGMFNIVSRGFKLWSYARNGLATSVWRTGTEIANLERIELIKGPSGTLFGSSASSFGGALNLVTKKPYSEFGGQLSYSLGSFELSRTTLDVNTPLNEDKSLLFRLNAVHHKQNSYNEYGKGKKTLIAPSLFYQVNDKLSFLFDLEYFKGKGTQAPFTLLGADADFGSFEDIPVDFDASFYRNDLLSESEAMKYFFKAQYQLSDNWTSTTDISHINEFVDHSYQPYNNWIDRETLVPNVRLFGPRDRTSANFQQNFNGSFQTGSFRHNMLIGASFEYIKESATYRVSQDFDVVSVQQPYDLLGKTEVDQILSDPATVGGGMSGQNAFGLYMSDVIDWTDNLSTMLSLRLDRFERTEGDYYAQTSLSPKLGLIYQPVKDQVSLFVNYMSGFKNQAPGDQPDGSTFTPDPVFANQIEGGVKTELLDKKLNMTLSYYHIGIDNAIRTGDDLFIIQDGEQVSKGVEFELIANPLKGLNIVTGYAFNENKIIRAAANEGNLIQGAPQHMVNYWVSYRFPAIKSIEGIGIGFGGNYVDESFYNASNTMVIPSYHLLNATAFYETGKWRLGLKFNNITDEEYWDISGNQQFTRNVTGNITFMF
ncbi:TonB-dependent receptor [Galbibacter sp. EGI 63066]|uniref:TonB-dependent receptor n=1 Tax=Galbibacter sp. EGI 63066 TaxID=2993559 RepID=UPI0022497768|nr:TonB-dependent receptor [Galbibacter sp. EGI 63066]MCX2679286.1 TonB-dependent receptor [Galbibacter sp. EGI 63066]